MILHLTENLMIKIKTVKIFPTNVIAIDPLRETRPFQVRETREGTKPVGLIRKESLAPPIDAN